MGEAQAEGGEGVRIGRFRVRWRREEDEGEDEEDEGPDKVAEDVDWEDVRSAWTRTAVRGEYGLPVSLCQ